MHDSYCNIIKQVKYPLFLLEQILGTNILLYITIKLELISTGKKINRHIYIYNI